MLHRGLLITRSQCATRVHPVRIRIHGPRLGVRLQQCRGNSIHLGLLLQTASQLKFKQVWLIWILREPSINQFVSEFNGGFFHHRPTRCNQNGLRNLKRFSNLLRQKNRQHVKPGLLRFTRCHLQLWIFGADRVGKFFQRRFRRQAPLSYLLRGPHQESSEKLLATHANRLLKCLVLIKALFVFFQQFRHTFGAPLAL